MPSFTGLSGYKTPFGKNQYLRSTRATKFESYTLADGSVPARTIDGVSTRLIQSGVVMAKITSGGDSGKIGPFQPGTVVTESVSLAQTATGGTFTLTFGGETTAALAFNATAATVQTALEALANIDDGDITVTGGPLGTAPVVVTFGGQYMAEDVPNLTVNGGSLTGGSLTATVTAGQQSGGAGVASDGRENPDNIVGILDTFLPWQLNERDVEVAVLYDGDVVQAYCLELNAAGTDFTALTDATAEYLRGRKKLDIRCH